MCLHLAQRRRRGGGKARPGCETKIAPTPSSSGTKRRRHFCAVGRAQGSNLGTVLVLHGRCSSSWLGCGAECPKLGTCWEHGGIFTALASCKAQSDGNARFYRKSCKPQLCRKERKRHVPSVPHFPIFINDSRKLSCSDKYFYLQSR